MRRLLLLGSALFLALGTTARLQQPDPLPTAPGTFSILGFDPATGEVGGAVASRVFSVGNGVLWAEADVGVAATQAIVDVSYGPKALELLRAGMTPAAIIRWYSSTEKRRTGNGGASRGITTFM